MKRHRHRTTWLAVARAGTLAAIFGAHPSWSQGGADTPVVALPPALRHGRELLQARQFVEARRVFAEFLKAHPAAVQAELGLGDAELGLRQPEAAEATYRHITAAEPQLWQAHKDLVLVEAALGRWEEFDRERTVLRMARERNAPGISRQESDLIDTFNVAGGHWLVRSYFEPVGRSQARYNFERFSPEGRIQAYISLEDKAAAQAALTPGDVRIGAAPANAPNTASSGPLVLNWYTGAAHGTIRSYPASEPTYEQVRADVRRWLASHENLAGGHPLEANPATSSPNTHRNR